MSVKGCLVAFLSVIFLGRFQAQNIEIGGIFPTIDHSGSISNRWEYSFYYFGAFSVLNPKINDVQDTPHLGAFYSEQALHYRANQLLTLSGAYVYERQNALRANYRNENRFYLQATIKYKLKRTNIKHRLRYDGRYIQSRVTHKWPYTHRLRYLVGFSFPLKKENDKLYFAAYNEFFFNLNKHSVAIYGENWAFVGMGLKTPRTGTFEVGPLYIFWVNNKNNDLTNFYYLQLTWITHINFKNKKQE